AGAQQQAIGRHWRTRADPLAEVWNSVLLPMLERSPQLEPQTLLPGCPTQLQDPLQQNGSHVIGWAGSHESVGLRNQSKSPWHPVPGSMLS
ncbi:MAG: hypothetical protein ACO27O_12345, partial [Hylemonella sp.]